METDPGKNKNRPGYETRDANPRTLAYSGITLAVTVVLMLLISRWVFFDFQTQQPLGPAATPFEVGRQLPPEPRIQSAPAQDLQSYLQQQKDTLRGYGWVDPQNGVVRIPIDRAKQLLLERGLPARQQPPQEDSAAGPGDSASPDAFGGSAK